MKPMDVSVELQTLVVAKQLLATAEELFSAGVPPVAIIEGIEMALETLRRIPMRPKHNST